MAGELQSRFFGRPTGFSGLKIEVFSVFLQSSESCKSCQKNQKSSYFETCSSPEYPRPFSLLPFDRMIVKMGCFFISFDAFFITSGNIDPSSNHFDPTNHNFAMRIGAAYLRPKPHTHIYIGQVFVCG